VYFKNNAARPSDTFDYIYQDNQGDASYWYQTQYLSSMTAAVSDLSSPQPSESLDTPPLSSTVTCFIRLIGLDIRPMVDHRVTINNVFLPNKVTSGGKTWGAFRNYLELRTDETGYAAARLLRGATVDMNVAGTGFTRRLTIPSDTDSVDLLDPALSTTDEFGIQVPNVPFAIRTS
jgi:hypothetical protein